MLHGAGGLGSEVGTITGSDTQSLEAKKAGRQVFVTRWKFLAVRFKKSTEDRAQKTEDKG